MKSNGMSGTYVKMIRNMYNSIFNQAVRLEAVNKNPCDNLVLPKSGGRNEMKVLTKDEQEKFIHYCYDNNEFLFIFMLGTGVRIGEAIGLTWDCIDFEEEIILIKNTVVAIKGIPKLQNYAKSNSSVRNIPMSAKVKKILIELKKINNMNENPLNLVFAAKNKHTIRCAVTTRATLGKISNILNIVRVNPHMLRHTFATRMLESNVNIKILSEVLGHKNIQITLDKYAHVLPDTKKDNINKIDNFL